MSRVPEDIDRALLSKLFCEESFHTPIKRPHRDTTAPEYDNELKIVYWPVTNKRSERSPDYDGRLTINEVKYTTSLWEKTSKAGKSYLSGNLKRF